ncbi:MAG: RnfABCDGE type electron transport complex subunit B [Alysiella sp.]|uniref:RnfABCDGE type electron transport complex subunit B n=1 Tax=Alysiella sp. TaxID=1872483 RepID=UPI0026DBA6E7|nr:RnfABCDGE type electron transport complex subunit B [Alysiella sp.]MDO4433548.1 RnfABCDGE type electron transport complex subunit B [Alysiella sp.]
MNPTAQQLNQFLPQTQCRDCGFSGCLPYAEAMAQGQADINLCAPGGVNVIRDLAKALRLPEIAPAQSHQNALAWIDEAVCIGCTACIRACPVDAIMGASKLMHTVIADECTGCGLCVAPCPVDCIHMQPVADEHLPRARYLAQNTQSERFAAAEHALQRYQNHTHRLDTLAAQRAQHLATQRCIATEKTDKDKNIATPTQTLNAATLIAQAKARAQAQQNERAVPSNRDSFRETQIKEAQNRATFRRYQQQAQYGNESEKAAAIEWLRRYKQEQEAKELARLAAK